MEDDALERAVLSAVDAAGASTVDTAELAERLGVDHTRVVGVVKSLEAYNLITAQARARALGPSCRDPGRGRGRRRPSPHLTPLLPLHAHADGGAQRVGAHGGGRGLP